LHQLLGETGRRYPLRMIKARVAISAMVWSDWVTGSSTMRLRDVSQSCFVVVAMIEPEGEVSKSMQIIRSGQDS